MNPKNLNNEIKIIYKYNKKFHIIFGNIRSNLI